MKLIPKHLQGKKVYLPQDEVTFVQPYTILYQDETYPIDDSRFPGAVAVGITPLATRVVTRQQHPYVSAMDDVVGRAMEGVGNYVVKMGKDAIQSSENAPWYWNINPGSKYIYGAATSLLNNVIDPVMKYTFLPAWRTLTSGFALDPKDPMGTRSGITPLVANEAADKAATALLPSRLIGTVRSPFTAGGFKFPWDEDNPGFVNDPTTNAIFDISLPFGMKYGRGMRYTRSRKPIEVTSTSTLAEVDPARAAEMRAAGFDPEKIPVSIDKNGNITHIDYSNYRTNPIMAGNGLSQAQIEKGWRQEGNNTFFSPKGDLFVIDPETGRLISEESLKLRKKNRAEAKRSREREKANTSEGKVLKIYNQYKNAVLDSARKTGINWSHSKIDNPGTIMEAVDNDFLLSPVGRDTQTPFLKRYYDNVLEIIKPGGLQDELLQSKELRINPETHRWEGLVRGKYQYVRPTEYIKMRLAQSKGIDVILPGKGVEGNTNYYPYHGTKNKDIKYLTRPSEVPGSSGYFTIINDGKVSSGNVRAKYKGNGYSFPLFMKNDVELLPLKNVGNSNSVHGTGTSLKSIVELNPGKIINARGVVDGTYGGYNQEYNFGSGVKDVKSMINTLDFESGAGPFAYSQNTSDRRSFT